MGRVIRGVDRGTRTVGGLEVHLTELVSDDGSRSFTARRTDTSADLTHDGHLDTWPTDDQLIHAQAGMWSCRCGATVDHRHRDLIADHLRGCDGAIPARGPA